MDIDELNLQAKRLMRKLPEFVAKHPKGVAELDDCLNFLANLYGAEDADEFKRDHHPDFEVELFMDMRRLFDKKGQPLLSPHQDQYARFKHKRPEVILDLENKVNDFIAKNCEMRKLFFNMTDIRFERFFTFMKSLLEQEPSFINGHLIMMNLYVNLKRFDEGAQIGQWVFDKLTGLLPSDFDGRINYWEPENREFHRIAQQTVLCYIKQGTLISNMRANIIVKKMLKWWPEDNMRFADALMELKTSPRKAA